ncbi:hypothetical protein JVU11DRAFT_11868 [Chiua virens]|nr:hypothetical protein JVU11DRAFT_11868 [Chiua virens]
MVDTATGKANARAATAERTQLLSTLHIKQITANLTEELRHLVLWPDKPLDYVRLDDDKYGHHFGAFVSSRDSPVAVISIFFEPVPSSVINGCTASTGNGTSARFRKFACHPQFQGRGIGTRLLRYATSYCSSAGATVLWCDARLSSSEWYEKRGLIQFGSTFFKDKVEYTRMKMVLQDSDSEAEGSCDH